MTRIDAQSNRGTLQPTAPPPAAPVQPATPAVAAPPPRYTPAAPVAVTETVPVVPPPPVVAPVAIPKPPVAPALPAPAQGFQVALTSSVGAGTQALTVVLVFLVTGAWLFGNRISSQLSFRRRNHVHGSA
jgi:hypothetical protein